MKQLISIILIIIATGCSTTRKIVKRDYSKGIVYDLPGNVQMLLSKKGQSKNTYFVIEKIDKLQFRLYQQEFTKRNNWIENTNRYISVAGDLYPALIQFDYYFANTETAEEFLNDNKNGIYKRTRVNITRHYVYHIDFTIHGEILYEGFNL